MRLLSNDFAQNPDFMDAIFAQTGGLCEKAIPFLPLGWLMDCEEKAKAQYRAGCVHEHVRTGRFCPRHGLELLDSQAGCRPCFEAGHECQMHVLAVEELA